MKTNKKATENILNQYLQNDGNLNKDYLIHLITVTAVNDYTRYNERFNTRRKIENIAINELMYFINIDLQYNGYEGFYATNKQVMEWNENHNKQLDAVLDGVIDDIIRTRNENN